MKLSDALRSPKYQVVILAVLLVLYLLSPNDFFRVVFGILTAFTFLAMVALEMKSGVDQQGWKNEIKDTAVLIIVVLIFWFAIQFILNTSSPISAVVTCSMLPNLERGDFAIVQGAIPNAHEIELTSKATQEMERMSDEIKGAVFSLSSIDDEIRKARLLLMARILKFSVLHIHIALELASEVRFAQRS